MLRYLLRRLLQAVPTVLGVILLTFILFYAVGGSPASAVLGQHASAQALAEFDARHGYDLPLFFGNWTATRALDPVDFATAPPRLRAAWDAGGSPPDPLRLDPGQPLPLPLAFPLPPGQQWRLLVRGEGLPRETRFPSGALPDLRAGPGGATVRTVRLQRATRHFFDSQLLLYLRQLARLDFGVSTSLNQPVSRLLRAGLLPSLALTVPIALVELAVSLTLALLCAWRRDSLLDRSLVAVCVALMSVNYIVWIVLGQYFLAYRLRLFPVWGFESWANLLLPVLVGVATGLGANVRFYRTVILEETRKDYVRTALAKGLPVRRILFRHVLKNALGPVIVNVSLSLPYLFTGSILLESFFGIPGLGYLGINAIHSSDVAVIRAVVLVSALLFVLANLLADLALAAVDPRVKLS